MFFSISKKFSGGRAYCVEFHMFQSFANSLTSLVDSATRKVRESEIEHKHPGVRHPAVVPKPMD